MCQNCTWVWINSMNQELTLCWHYPLVLYKLCLTSYKLSSIYLIFIDLLLKTKLHWILFLNDLYSTFPCSPYIKRNLAIIIHAGIKESKMSFLYSTFLAITVLIGYGMTYPLSQFYPFGSAAGDSNLPANDDGSTSSIHISVPFPFFGSSYSSVFVSAFKIYFFVLLYLNLKHQISPI